MGLTYLLKGKEYMTDKKFLYVFVLLIVIISCETVFAWEYIGHTEAVQSVQICPEISARVTKIHFHEGDFVNKSAALFTLDNAELQAEVSLKKAELAMASAKFDGVAKYYARLKATKKAMSASDLDNAESEERQAKAGIDAAKASLKLAEIQLGHTKITAPFAGQIGKTNFHVGSYVSPENVLCEIVQTNPIRILFAMPDRDYLRVKNAWENLKYELILADGSLYSGTIEKDFEDNVMNSDTGTINIWLKVSNENNILLPGALVRVKVTQGE